MRSLSVVVVEDHDALRRVTVDFLQSLGHRVVGVADGEALDECLAQEPVDVVMLDLNLPGEDGLSICRRLRARSPSLWIVMLTARTAPEHRALGYQQGADIYLTKPATHDELAATLASVARRLYAHQPQAALQASSAALSVSGPLGKEWVTDAEMKLLRGLALAANQQLEYWQLFDLLDLTDHEDAKAALEVRVARLRKKLLRVGAAEPAIQALRRIGYQLMDPVHMA